MPNEVREARGSPRRTPGSSRSHARLDSLRQLITQLSDVTGAHQEKNVVRAHKTFEGFACPLKRTHVHRIGNQVRQVGRLDAGGVVLAGAIYIHDQHAVGGAERTREALKQCGQAGIAVGLKHDDEAAMPQLSRSLQRGPHLGRVVRVVVIDGGALEHAEELQPAMRAREPFQRAGHVREAHAQLERHRGGRGRVLHVVPAGLAKVDPSQLVPRVVDRERPAFIAAVVGTLAEAVRDASGGGLERARALVVRRQDRDAVGGQGGHELRKQVPHRVHVLEMIGMVELDVGDDRALGVVEDEGAIGFVYLGDEPPGLAGAGARAVADQDGRIEPCLGEDVAGHVGHGGLACAAAHRDRVGVGYELGQHLGAGEHLDAHRPRRLELGRLLDGPAVYEQVLEEDVLRVVTYVDPNAGVLQRRRGVRLAQVATADLVAAGKEHASQRRHAGAADAHQVHLHFRATSWSTASTRCAASRRPAPAEAFAIARSRSVLRRSSVATRLAGLSSSSAMRTAAPASTIALAFSSWWPPPNVPGTSTIGRPTAAISAIVLTPARLTTRSASAISRGMSSVKESPRYPGDACSATPADPCGPAMWTTSSKRLRNSSSAAHTASLMWRAPWLPPVTSRRRGGTAAVRGSNPSRSGTPVISTRLLRTRFSVPGSVVQIAAAPRANQRVARPGRTSFSCST